MGEIRLGKLKVGEVAVGHCTSSNSWDVVKLSERGLTWEVLAGGFASEEDAKAWKDNQQNAEHTWKMPAWMIPHCGTDYLQDVRTVIWHMNDKTPVQVNAPLALFAEHTAGEVRMLTYLHDAGMLVNTLPKSGTLGHFLAVYEKTLRSSLIVYERETPGVAPIERYSDWVDRRQVPAWLREMVIENIYEADGGGIVVIVK